MNQENILTAAKIKMLILDVDGVMTDGGLYYDHMGMVMKRFHVHDGLGIKVAQAAGLDLAVITGLTSPAVEARIRELGIRHFFQGFTDKLPLIEKLAEKENIRLDQIAYLGDDWVDAGVMQRVGLAMAVSNSQPQIKEIARWVGSIPGGHGAVREAIMFILSAQGKDQKQWLKWITPDD